MSTEVTTIDLKRMTLPELRREIAVHSTEYAKMRMRVEMQNEKNHALFKSKRREIARMHTVLTAMEKKSISKTTEPAKVAKSSEGSDSVQKTSQTKKKPVKVSRSK